MRVHVPLLYILLSFLCGTASYQHAKHDPHGHEHRLKHKRPQKFELDAPALTPPLPLLEKHWHQPVGIKQAPARPAAAHGPAAPEVLRQRAVVEQMFGRAGVQEYLDHRNSVQLLNHGRERLRKAIAIAENFESLRLIAEESQVMHVLAEAVYALDAGHMKAGRERVYRAYELVESMGPERPSLMKLDGAWTDLGDRCDHTPDCSKFSKCEKKRCQPPRFPRTTRVFVNEMLAQLKHRVLEHVWDFGMDELDHHARMWGGNGTNGTIAEAAPPAALVRLLLHAGASDPLLQQDRAVIRSLLATAIGSSVPVESVLEVQVLYDILQFEVHGKDEVQAANTSARTGGLAGLGRAVLEEFDPTDVVYTRPNGGICSTMDVETECCSGRDVRSGRLNGLQVHDSPCQIVMRATGQWQCQPSVWVVQHLQKALKEDVVVVACNATEDVQHITKHVGHKRRRLAEQSHVEAHHKVRYRVAHNYAIDDDRVPGGHTGMTHPDLVPHWHRYDSRHAAAEKCDEDPECLGYTCNTMGFKTHDDDDDHVLWCELRQASTSAQHEGHHRGRHAPGHISFFKRYDTVGALGGHLSAVPTPEVPLNQPHSALLAAQARRASNFSTDALGMTMRMNASSTDQLGSSSRNTDYVQHGERDSQPAQVLTARMTPVDSVDQNSAIQPSTGEAKKTESAASHLQELLDRTRHLPGAASQ